MSKPRRRTSVEFNYAEAFDAAMNAQFPGEDFKTEWSIFAGSWGGYVTRRANGKGLTKAHALFGRGFGIGLRVGQLNPQGAPA